MVPRINATVDQCAFGRATLTGYPAWKVTVWKLDDEAARAVYTIPAPTDNEAAQIGMRRFLAERADATERALDVRSDGSKSQH